MNDARVAIGKLLEDELLLLQRLEQLLSNEKALLLEDDSP